MLSTTRTAARDRRVLTAAVELLGETGVDQFTFDALAGRAGVSKATLYRRWPSKSELIAEAVRRRVGLFLMEFDRQSFRGDVLHVLTEVTAWLVRDAAVLRTLTDASRRDDALREAVERRLAWPLDAVWEDVLDRARARGELRSDVDLSWLNELCQAVLFNRILVVGDPVTEAFLQRLTDEIIVPTFTGSRPT
ncbi:TetR/AcrR family transcriptional regulator [Streptomyces phaeochromogenes]|uniref:TetR/AcrR family transcriptional regulator n=1 Tax=Streptomyces phaeochromogenes TaxID=1923 RepID=UPI00368CFF1B